MAGLLDFLTCGRLELTPLHGSPVEPVTPSAGRFMYDAVVVGDRPEYQFIEGADSLIAMLHERFPSEAERIGRFEGLLSHYTSSRYMKSLEYTHTLTFRPLPFTLPHTHTLTFRPLPFTLPHTLTLTFRPLPFTLPHTLTLTDHRSPITQVQAERCQILHAQDAVAARSATATVGTHLPSDQDHGPPLLRRHPSACTGLGLGLGLGSGLGFTYHLDS